VKTFGHPRPPWPRRPTLPATENSSDASPLRGASWSAAGFRAEREQPQRVGPARRVEYLRRGHSCEAAAAGLRHSRGPGALSLGQRFSKARGSCVRAKAPSPLRFAGAVHDANGFAGRVVIARALWSAATCRRFPTGRHVAQFQSADMSAHSMFIHPVQVFSAQVYMHCIDTHGCVYQLFCQPLRLRASAVRTLAPRFHGLICRSSESCPASPANEGATFGWHKPDRSDYPAGVPDFRTKGEHCPSGLGGGERFKL
jgi:hypothetical protein